MTATTTVPAPRAANPLTYTRYEIVRTFRAVRFFMFSLAFPIILFFLIAGPNRHGTIDGIDAPLYFMTGMAAWGAMVAVIASGARIAGERAVGWTRQLRITPLSTRAYFRAKALTGYLMATLTLAVLYLSGMSLGVRLGAGDWAHMTVLIYVGLVPFALLGILLGHLLTVDSLGPVMGGVTAIFALFGGTWGPIATGGALHAIVQWIPSYWLVQAAKTSLGGDAWPPRAWLVMGIWTVVLGALARWAYLRDTKRV
jgi:ABC-2 type transport system permease protein